jgi:hypothetical protein
LLLPEGQTGEGWDVPKSSAVLEIGGHWIEGYFHLVFSARQLNAAAGTVSVATQPEAEQSTAISYQRL